jgi:glucose/arabinose dehydrogenase
MINADMGTDFAYPPLHLNPLSMRNFYPAPLRVVCILFSFFSLNQSVKSQPVLAFTTVASGLTKPVDLVPEPGTNRLFVVEHTGNIRIIDGSTVLATSFLNLSGIISNVGEQGLLSLAFHPDYVNNRYFFVYYTNNDNQIEVARYQRNANNADIADASSGKILLNITKQAENHNGGKLNFGPDGMLYFATGDGGGANDDPNNAQTGNSLLGKMLRLNVDNFATPPYYTIPADNPFVGSGDNIRDEIWALGLRNPWRWSFDKSNGDMWIADVGQGTWEEVNYTPLANSKGVDFGWHCMEGNHNTPGVTVCDPGPNYKAPIFEYGHDMATGGLSITGGYVYRGNLYPSLRGYFVATDYVSKNVWIIQPNGAFNRRAGTISNVSSFGQDSNGELYALSYTGGTVSRISVANESPLPLTLINFSGKDYSGYNELIWTTGFEENINKYIVEYSINGTDYQTAGELASKYGSAGGGYTFKHSINNQQVIRYRLRITELDNKQSYSPIISIGEVSKKRIQVYPTLVSAGSINIISTLPVMRLSIFTLEGKEVYVKYMGGSTGYTSVPLSGLKKGLYLMKLSGDGFNQTDKIIIQ